ncbi:putative FBD-associated F-box protein At5g53635 [Argentina anserina]|uniref:putative FBD-associated F-box protein At5g53635 n=1 Tax=Argentina anserina TaxID=57926 RepID=UPI0021767F1B|nr:putative FBD-associated F-box protein At5g53635 [Potentilla anserina]
MVSIDRISALPDELGIHILCFMPTKDAVATSILSTRWKALWTRLPCLNFYDERDFGDHNEEDVDVFDIFVSHVLHFPDSVDIEKCALVIHNDHDVLAVDDWICTLVRRKVVEFYFAFTFDLGTTFRIPQALYMCKTLKILTLHLYTNNFTADDPPALGCFPNLKELHAALFGIQLSSLVKFCSCCPGIEVLTIDGMVERGDDEVCDIQVLGRELKMLKVSFECDPHNTSINVYINAPKLETLYLRMDGLSNYFLMGSTRSLAYVTIAYAELGEEKPLHFPNQPIAILGGVSNVRYLSLWTPWFKDWHLPALGNLNQLKLVLWDCNYVESLAGFLHSAPNLEDLVLETSIKFEVEDSVVQWNPHEDVPVCLSSHLKTISITGFRGRQDEMEMAKYLLMNGPFLKKMTIYADLSCADEDLYKEFSMFQRTNDCQVELIMMQTSGRYDGRCDFRWWVDYDCN